MGPSFDVGNILNDMTDHLFPLKEEHVSLVDGQGVWFSSSFLPLCLDCKPVRFKIIHLNNFSLPKCEKSEESVYFLTAPYFRIL